MNVKLIANVIEYKGQLLIGNDNDLVVRSSEDLEHFKRVTMGSTLVMGRKTWESIGSKNLPGRDSIVISNKKGENTMTLEKFYDTASKDRKKTYFIIGGSEIFNTVLQNIFMPIKELFITETRVNYKLNLNNYKCIDYIPSNYKIISTSEEHTQDNVTLRFIKYIFTRDKESSESKYMSLLRKVIIHGESRIDRTNTGTFSCFGEQLKFDISRSIPLMTTKRVPWKSCIKELLWFLQGHTDTKILEKQGVNIWKGNTSREFLDSRNLKYREGILGPGYGHQWRFSGAEYSEKYANTSKGKPKGGIDQIMNAIELLKKDPSSRRIVVNSWNVSQIEQMALPPCHAMFQFYASGVNLKDLSCHIFLRSNDLFLGAPFNIFEYAVLTYIISLKCDMKPKELVYTVSDAHVYSNHVLQGQEVLSRVIRSEPVLIMNPSIRDKDFSEMSEKDFDIVGYFPDTMIKADMAV
jgi:thymidylate synthase